mmetsp:Transcript_102536/g.173779  ORF Transcript_102536/g.173779 Transcript_102536/m.173779 type:complete len:136 (+) Transcript_102536:45-452(+)
MGKRRARAKPMAKKKYLLPTTYDCPFCDHKGSVEIKINTHKGHARLACGSCGVNFQMSVSSLDDPIDVYHEWIDQCATIQKDDGGNSPTVMSRRAGSDDEEPFDGANDEDDDDDGFIVHDDPAEDDAAEFAPPDL